MKETTKLNEHVFNLWSVDHMTFSQISNQQIPSFLSLKRIRNIRASGPARLKSDHEKKIYSLFRMKFLELKDVKAATLFVYSNQPTISITDRNARYIISYELKKRSRKREMASQKSA